MLKSKMNEQLIAKATFTKHYTAAVTAGVTDGAAIDRQGYGGAFCVLSLGGFSATGTAAVSVTLYTSDTATVTGTLTGTWTLYATANYSWSGFGTAVASASGLYVDLAGAKRYIAPAVSMGALGAASANVTFTVILGDAINEPAT